MSAVEIEGRRLVLTNLDKVLWPEPGRTKAWMIEYYAHIAPVLLPHLRDRPLTMRRFPDGVEGVSWHQNECRGEPDWLGVFETHGRAGRLLRFCLVQNVPSLVWLANQGAIELHAFQWSIDAPRQPVALVFDLDPGPPADLVDCARVALYFRDVLAESGLASFPKTSGSLGMHLHVPLRGPHEGEQLKVFARGVAEFLAQRHPDEIVTKMQKTRRTGKVFVDWLQNDPSRQTVAPYSLRGMPFPTVAAPVTWDEVEQAAAKRRPELLTFLGEEMLKRVDRVGDLFADVLELKQTLSAPHDAPKSAD